MSKLLEVTEELIHPIYSHDNPNQDIVLGEYEAILEGRDTPCTVSVIQRFLPKDRIHILYPIDEEPLMLGHKFIDGSDTIGLTILKNGITLNCMCIASGGDVGGLLFMPNKSPIVVSQHTQCIQKATFHLFNFPDFLGPDDYIIRSEGSWKRYGRVVLEADGWLVTIAATKNTKKIVESLKSEGGFALTHTGLITRTDGSSFSSEQLSEITTCLSYFLSYALGRWTCIAFPVGFDIDKNIVFEKWGLGRVHKDDWNGSLSWFDELHGEILSEVFPGFMSLWNNELWRESLRSALYWYLGAGDRDVGIGVDTAVILSQSSLEVLSWTYCVLEHNLLTKNDFNSRIKPAADRLKCIIEHMNIPSTIPDCLPTLIAKWSDGMEAITKLRNSLLHPDNSNKYPSKMFVEAWKLSLWYIDLIILCLCGHNGKYANRLSQRWVGTIESVPWADEEIERSKVNG